MRYILNKTHKGNFTSEKYVYSYFQTILVKNIHIIKRTNRMKNILLAILISVFLTANIFALGLPSKAKQSASKVLSWDITTNILFIYNEKAYIYKYLGDTEEEMDNILSINELLFMEGLSMLRYCDTLHANGVYYGYFRYYGSINQNTIIQYSDFNKIGSLLAIHDNIMLGYPRRLAYQDASKIEDLKGLLASKIYIEPKYKEMLNNIITTLERNAPYLTKSVGYFDFHLQGTSSIKRRMIDPIQIHKGWRIDNFLSILILDNFIYHKKLDFEILDAINGYQEVSRVRLNFSEIQAIFDIIIAEKIKEKILNRRSRMIDFDLDKFISIRNAV
jgi:hypothetical protein